ncbi:MAG: YicC/YloC family endoribonuclease [Candidatus Neomarinimicrobiota bacterium]
MIQSMTGYGNTTSGKGSNRFTISIKTVNARFLDIKFKGCDLEPNVEKEIRDIISEKLVRGTVFINFDQNLTSNDEASHFNEERFEMLLSVIDRIDKKYKKRINIDNVMNINDFFQTRNDNLSDFNELLKNIKSTCTKVVIMRKQEGVLLKKDIDKRIEKLKNILDSIEKQIPLESRKRSSKLKKRISDLLESYQFDESRLNQEIALLSEKSDITEEVVRLRSHFSQFKKISRENKPAGKRLAFLLQEISREINTIGSKSFSEKIINKVIMMKDEAEKIREQVQNIL